MRRISKAVGGVALPGSGKHRIAYIVLHLALCILFTACGHVNKLADYPVQGARYFFKNIVPADAAVVHASIMTTDTSAGIVAMSAMGERITNEQLQSRLDHISTTILANAAGRGMHEILTGYLHGVEVPTAHELPSFLVETVLKEYELRSSGSGAEVRVSLATRIIDRAGATVIWDDNETKTVVLQSSLFPKATGTAALFSSVASAARLLSLSDEELLRILEHASEDAGRDVGETFRMDIEKVKK